MSTAKSASLRTRGQDLAGKTAVVTGASKGIGRATAVNRALRGCSVLGTCSKDENIPAIESISGHIADAFKDGEPSSMPKIVGIKADIFSSGCTQIISSCLEQQLSGKVDIFINNAADARDGVLGELAVEEIQQSLVANIQTPVLIVEEFVKRKMFRLDSRIVYISSIRTRQLWSGQLMYGATKSAGESLCRTWARAFGGRDERLSISLLCGFAN